MLAQEPACSQPLCVPDHAACAIMEQRTTAAACLLRACQCALLASSRVGEHDRFTWCSY